MSRIVEVSTISDDPSTILRHPSDDLAGYMVGGGGMDRGARWLVVGWDGATWDLAERFMAEGRMPFLQGLRRGGAWARLASTVPAMTLPAWSSLFTGCSPGLHGILDFTRRLPGTYDLGFLNATHRLVPDLARLVSEQGGRVACVAVPGTYPPERVHGVMIAGFDSPVATAVDASFCEPRGLHAEIRRRFGGLRFADFQEIRIGPGWHEQALDAILAELPRKEALCSWLMKQERWDVFMMVFGESDTVSHHFWMFHDERSPRFDRRAPARLREAIATVYSRLDATLGRLVDEARPDLFCLVSDHGFGGAGVHAIYLNRFLESHGWLATRGSRGNLAVERLRQGALRHLPARLQEGMARRLPPRLIAGLEAQSRWGDLDFSRTRAFSDEMAYAATLHLNLEGRDPLGTIRDPDAATREVEELLLSWRVDGAPVVRAVHRREDLYQGPGVERAPDLLLELEERDGYSLTMLPSHRVSPGTTWRRLEPREHMGGKGRGMNGTHRSRGILVLDGKGVKPGVEVDAAIQDVLPTLLHLAGEAVPAHMDGRACLGACMRGESVRISPRGPSSGDGRPLDPGEEALLARRLRSLGYLV